MSNNQWNNAPGDGGWQPQQSGQEWGGSPEPQRSANDWNSQNNDWGQNTGQASASDVPAPEQGSAPEPQASGSDWNQPQGSANDWNQPQTSANEWNQQPQQDWNQQQGWDQQQQGWDQQAQQSANDWNQQGQQGWDQQPQQSANDWNQQGQQGWDQQPQQGWDQQPQQGWGQQQGQPSQAQQWSQPRQSSSGGPGIGSLFDFGFKNLAIPAGAGILYMVTAIALGVRHLIGIIQVLANEYMTALDMLTAILQHLITFAIWLILIRVFFEGMRALVGSKDSPKDDSAE